MTACYTCSAGGQGVILPEPVSVERYERTVTWVASKTKQSSSGSAELYGSSPASPFLKMKGSRKDKSIGWDDLEPDLLCRTAARVTESGALFSLSKTSDGGALHIYVKNGPEVVEAYFANVQAATDYLLELYEAFA